MDHTHHTGTHHHHVADNQALHPQSHEDWRTIAVHDKHAGHHTEDFIKRFWICLGITVPVLLLAYHLDGLMYVTDNTK